MTVEKMREFLKNWDKLPAEDRVWSKVPKEMQAIVTEEDAPDYPDDIVDKVVDIYNYNFNPSWKGARKILSSLQKILKNLKDGDISDKIAKKEIEQFMKPEDEDSFSKAIKELSPEDYKKVLNIISC